MFGTTKSAKAFLWYQSREVRLGELLEIARPSINEDLYRKMFDTYVEWSQAKWDLIHSVEDEVRVNTLEYVADMIEKERKNKGP